MQRALLDPRILRLVRQDSLIAITALAGLWLLYGFVFIRLTDFAYDLDPRALGIIGVSGATVLLLNSAAIFVLVRRLLRPAEVARIYEPDLFHTEASRNFHLTEADDE